MVLNLELLQERWTKMTPEEALVILDDLASKISTTREGHLKLQEAVNTLDKFIKENKVQK